MENQMQPLMVKYIDKINAFKENLESTHQTTDLGLTFKSNYTWLGESLVIQSKFGDKMSIFEEDATPITYQYAERSKQVNDKQFAIKITETFKEHYILNAKTVECDERQSFFYEYPNGEKSKLFNSIDEMIDDVVKKNQHILCIDIEDQHLDESTIHYTWRDTTNET